MADAPPSTAPAPEAPGTAPSTASPVLAPSTSAPAPAPGRASGFHAELAALRTYVVARAGHRHPAVAAVELLLQDPVVRTFLER
jgi:hypothetical protein